jgi:hypothetical protein
MKPISITKPCLYLISGDTLIWQFGCEDAFRRNGRVAKWSLGNLAKRRKIQKHGQNIKLKRISNTGSFEIQ